MKRQRILAVNVIASMLGVAAPVISPAVAQEAACTTWSVGMLEDEGGPVLTAQACSTDRPDAYLFLTCYSGDVSVRYDLELGSEAQSDEPSGEESAEKTDVTFTTATDAVTLPMGLEEMDGMHAAYKAGDSLLQLLKSGDTVTIGDVSGRYPPKHFSLKGSAAALGKLVADCD